jgi:hypothetical protein
VEVDDVGVRAAMPGSPLNLGRRRPLPAPVMDQVVAQVDPAGLDAACAELRRGIAALPR